MKLIIIISLTIFGTLGSFLGELLDHGNWLGGWGIIFSTIGSFVGIWIGVKFYKNYLA